MALEGLKSIPGGGKMRKRDNSLLVLALILMGMGCMCLYFSKTVLGFPQSYQFLDLEIGRQYAQFHSDWEYVSDGEMDLWQYKLDHRGDCEDFAITFYKELSPAPLNGWLITVPGNPGHALLFLHTEEGWFALDNNRFVLRGENFLDLYRMYPEVQGMYELPVQNGIPQGDLKDAIRGH
jgi:hypothetical protein